jgi:hypothetical protein
MTGKRLSEGRKEQTLLWLTEASRLTYRSQVFGPYSNECKAKKKARTLRRAGWRHVKIYQSHHRWYVKATPPYQT